MQYTEVLSMDPQAPVLASWHYLFAKCCFHMLLLLVHTCINIEMYIMQPVTVAYISYEGCIPFVS